MPLRFELQDLAPLCEGRLTFSIDEEHLAKLVAHLLMGQYRHVTAVIARRREIGSVTVGRGAVEAVIERMTPSSQAERYHRDGWVFQMISWLVCRHAGSEGIFMARPHSQPADKGLDGLMIQVSQGDSHLVSITISEDKATENPRSTITSQVWPEIAEFESGRRDNELLSAVTAVLETSRSENIDALIQQIFWKEHLRYRVNVPANMVGKEGMESLFKGFDTRAIGPVSRRCGEVFVVSDIRGWMDSFCARVVLAIQEASA